MYSYFYKLLSFRNLQFLESQNGSQFILKYFDEWFFGWVIWIGTNPDFFNHLFKIKLEAGIYKPVFLKSNKGAATPEKSGMINKQKISRLVNGFQENLQT
jgi:hypothetical protein